MENTASESIYSFSSLTSLVKSHSKRTKFLIYLSMRSFRLLKELSQSYLLEQSVYTRMDAQKLRKMALQYKQKPTYPKIISDLDFLWDY